MDDSFDVVISGIGGHFPDSDNVDTLMEKLHLGESLITLDDRRWVPGKLGVDAHIGKVTEYQFFDNQFFGIHRGLASVTDPITRLLLERVAEAVLDAGLSPYELYGTKTSVYTSCSISENEATFLFSKNRAMAFTIMGTNRSMMANRISYFFNFNGRSCSYDGTWAWAGLGLQMAYTAIKSGECDSVIMGGTSLCLHPEMSVMYSGMNYLSPDGVCRPFDADANGFARAESQVVFLLQRSDRAKRAYAKVLGAKMQFDGTWERDLLSPTVGSIARVVGGAYEDAKVDKKKVKYVECYGTAYQPTDFAEVEGLKAVFGKGPEDPLLIGSVKGNVGHSEGPSGLVSVVKVISILRNGVIPKTLNYSKPNPRIPSLVDGSVKVVDENMPIDIDADTVVGSTSMSYGGNIGHVILGVASKNKIPVDPENDIPRLILACGRSEEEVKRVLTKISSVPFDPEYYRLVQDIFSNPIRSYNFRGSVICPSPPDNPLKAAISGRGGRPVWFVFSGMGSQWPEMGRDLLKIPAFSATIDRCHAVLETKGLDLRKILTHPEPDIFDNILHSFVGIAAVQVGLINIMRLLGIEPDGFIGHSVGEQACAYMDGCIDEEQTMLAAYARGMSSNEAKLIKGMMAAVGIGYNNIKDELPDTIEVACHNSSDNCTISGPADDVNEYVEVLKERKVFARAVNVSNTAYHSRYVRDAGPILMRRLSEVITEPKERSKRWISTSVPEERWDTEDARFCSATYLTNNLLGAVLFEEAMKSVPRNVILIEIAPHGLLQAILRRSAPLGTTNISLTQRGSADGLGVLYKAIAKMYQEGLCPKVSGLYPDVQFPVSRQTPSTADLATWNHTEPFYTTVDSVLGKEDYGSHININVETPAEIYRGNAVCCPSHFLRAVWDILASMRRFGTNEMAIEFENIRYFDPVDIPTKGENMLSLWIQQKSGNFEVNDDDIGLVVTGDFSSDLEEDTKEKEKAEEERKETEAVDIRRRMPENTVKVMADQVYCELASRGHTYRGNIMAITSIETSQDLWLAKVKHHGDMNAVLAAAFQLVQLCSDQSSQICTYPQYIRKICLDPNKFLNAYPEEAELYLDVKMEQVIARGLTITGLKFRPQQSDTVSELKLQASSLNFIPYGTQTLQSGEDVVSVGLQLALDTQPTAELGVTVLELSHGTGQLDKSIGKILRQLAVGHHNIDLNVIKMLIDSNNSKTKLPAGAKTCGIILTESSTLSASISFLDSCPSAIILAHLKADDLEALAKLRNLKVLAEHLGESDRTVLVRSLNSQPVNTQVIKVPLDDPVLESVNVSAGAVLVWQGMPSIGIRAVVDTITKLPRGSVVRMFFILDKNAPPFSTSHSLYRDQLALGMRINILQGGVWGSLKTLPLPIDAHSIPNGSDSLLAAVSTNIVEDTNINHWGLEHVSATKMSSELALDYCGEGPKEPVFGIAKAINGQPKLDPLLQWPVPKGWTYADAATVPVAYCQAYLALRRCIYRGMISTKDNVLVTEPLHPEGQAAIRVALASERFALVFVIARDEREQNTILSLFSDAVGGEKLRCIRSERHSVANALRTQNLFGTRLDIIVTVDPENVRTDILGVLPKYGNLICLGGAETAMRKSFGTRGFVDSTALFFVSAQSVLHMREDDRQSVHQAIAEGLKPNGFVRPLRRVIRSNISTVHALWNDQDAMNNKVVVRVKQSESPAFTFKPGSSCLIAGGTLQHTITLANWSAKRGIKQIVAVHSEQKSTFLQRHVDLLQAVYGAKLQVFPELRNGLTEALRNGSLSLIFAIAQDPLGERLAIELARFRSNVPLIVFGAKGSDHGALADSCVTRHCNAPHSLLLVGQMDHALGSRLMDWLLRNEKPPVITLLRCPAESRSQRIPAARLLKHLPQGVDSLAALGKSLVPLDQSPRLVDHPTNGPKYSHAREVFPIFVVPGLAASIDTVIQPLAKKLLVPLICVRLPEKLDSVTGVAKEISKLIRERQPYGPYTLLGFDWTAALTQQMAVELQQNDNKVTMFLLDGDASDVNEVASFLQRQDFESLLLSSCLDLQVNSSTYAEICALPSWSHRIRHLTPTFGEDSRVEVERALNAIRRWVDALAKHQVTNGQTDTYLIQTSAPADVTFVKTSTLTVMRCIDSHEDVLSTSKVQHYINDNTGYPSLQNTEACIKQASYL